MNQVYDIYRYLPSSTQVVVISATMTADVLRMTKEFMADPGMYTVRCVRLCCAQLTPCAVRILVKRDELTLDGIQQFFVAVEREEWKFDTLCDLVTRVVTGHSVS